MRNLLREFKEFAMRGNVLDMAVGIIIGAAFGKVVSSVVADVVMPPIGMAMGGVDFGDLAITLKEGVTDAAGKVEVPAVVIGYGKFVNTVLDFLIVALAVFLLVKAMNAAKRKPAPAPAAPPPAPPRSESLLEEIRDLLKKR
ncbi:MAG: large-conductance mechanosensitive channel protein MscL [Planctomycetota bacterium]